MRWKTQTVTVGRVGIGGDNPVRIQSMTTSDTRNVEKTVEQILRLEDAGCEIARVTVQGKKEAIACEAIKNALVQRGCEVPLVADIHFYPPAAMLVADFVDKVRINPGNFADTRAVFKQVEYTDAAHIEEKFAPLVEKCKKRGIAMRIGTNHGSLSDRIMSQYGDTPLGMIESAFEFARICRKLDYHNFLFSMKASNPLVMIQAYRLLVAEMVKREWNYPLHLGVTEAGNGEDGRIKSAVGIGTLLLDGLGDTIRVSLTEDPWFEIGPAKQMVAFAAARARLRLPVNPQMPKPKQGEAYTKPTPDKIFLTKPTREFFAKRKPLQPVILCGDYAEEDKVIHASMELGSLLIDGHGDGVCIEPLEFGMNLLQACRMKSFKTDFIACPGCGRTLFDLQTVTNRIKEKTGHLPGVKIAIMGCIVNGPGEMADADFGYVGSRPGKIDLYVGKTCVERNIDKEDAEEKLIELIKAYGKWIEPAKTSP